MNILLLTHYFTSGRGGAWYVIAIMAKLLAEKGHKVWVITNKLEGFESPKHDNINTFFVAEHKIQKTSFSLIDLLRYSFAVIKIGKKIIKNENIDVIHSDPLPGLAGSFLSWMTSVPQILVIHDVFSIQKGLWKESLKQKEISKSNAIIRPFFEKTIVRIKHSAIHTVSEAVKEDLQTMGTKRPIYVIPNAIPINQVTKLESKPFQLVSISRLTFYKNVQVVIKSLQIVKKLFSKVSLIIIGSGPYRKNLEHLVKELDLQENVIFKGHVSEQEKKELLAKSQALVFPSKFEGFGMVILEAFEFYKPVLVSHVRPQSDIVEDQKTGFVLAPDNESEWADAIKKLFNKPENVEKMGENGRITLEEKYNLEIMTKNILHMYEDVIKKK